MPASSKAKARRDFKSSTETVEKEFREKTEEIFFLTLDDEFEDFKKAHTLDGRVRKPPGALDHPPDSQRLNRRVRGLEDSFRNMVALAESYPLLIGANIEPEHFTPPEWAVERAEAILNSAFRRHNNHLEIYEGGTERLRASELSLWLIRHPRSKVNGLGSLQEQGIYSAIAARLLVPFCNAVRERLQHLAEASGNNQSDSESVRKRKRVTNVRPGALKYHSGVKRAILLELTKNPDASDREICRALDAEGPVELPKPWKSKPEDRSFFDAYADAGRRHKVEARISRVRADMRKSRLLPDR